MPITKSSMCITEKHLDKKLNEMENRLKEDVVRIADERFMEHLPKAITTSIKEAGRHYEMSTETKEELKKQDKRIAVVEGIIGDIKEYIKEDRIFRENFTKSIDENEKYHKEIKPLLEGIQNSVNFRSTLKSGLAWTATVVLSAGAIYGAIHGIIWAIIKLG